MLPLKSNKIKTHCVNISSELEQQRNGLPGRNAHVNILTLQQPWQLGQMSKTQQRQSTKDFYRTDIQHDARSSSSFTTTQLLKAILPFNNKQLQKA